MRLCIPSPALDLNMIDSDDDDDELEEEEKVGSQMEIDAKKTVMPSLSKVFWSK